MAACSLQAQPLCRAATPSSTTSQCRWSDSNCEQFSSSTTSGKLKRCSVVGSYSKRIGDGYAVGKKELIGRSWHLEVAMPGSGEQHRRSGVKVEAAKRVQSGRSYVLNSTLIVEEGKEKEVTALCKEITQWADMKMKEKGSGLQVFECNADIFEKNVYHFWERYDSFQSMNDLRSTPEHSEFMTKVRPLLVGPIGLAAYEYRDGQIGHMMNPIGPKGEGGLDDATGQSGTKQQSSAISQGLGEMEEDRESKAWGLDKLLAKVRGEDKESGWSFKTLFGSGTEKVKK